MTTTQSRIQYLNAAVHAEARDAVRVGLGPVKETGRIAVLNPRTEFGWEMPVFRDLTPDHIRAKCRAWAREKARDYDGAMYDVDVFFVTERGAENLVRERLRDKDWAAYPIQILPPGMVEPGLVLTPEEVRGVSLDLLERTHARLAAGTDGLRLGFADAGKHFAVVNHWGLPKETTLDRAEGLPDVIAAGCADPDGPHRGRGEASYLWTSTAATITVYAKGSASTLADRGRLLVKAMKSMRRKGQVLTVCLCPVVPPKAWASAPAPVNHAVPIEWWREFFAAIATEWPEDEPVVIEIWCGLGWEPGSWNPTWEQAIIDGTANMRRAAEEVWGVKDEPRPEPKPEPQDNPSDDARRVSMAAWRMEAMRDAMHEAILHTQEAANRLTIELGDGRDIAVVIADATADTEKVPAAAE